MAKLKEGMEYIQSTRASQLPDSEENKEAERDQENILELQLTIRIQELLLKEITNQNEQIIAKHHQALEQRDEVIMKIIEQKDEAIYTFKR